MSSAKSNRGGHQIPPGWFRGRGQAAQYLSINRRTLFDWEMAGHIRPIRINSRLAMYRREDLDAAILEMGRQYEEAQADNQTVPARVRKRIPINKVPKEGQGALTPAPPPPRSTPPRA